MGANYWEYAVAYHSDLDGVLKGLQQRVLAEHDYDLDLDLDEQWPATMEELWAREDVRFSGTASILDIERVIASDAEDDYGTLRPLSADEVRGYLGTTTPTKAAVAAALEGGDLQAHGQSQSASAVVAYDETGLPLEWVLWGFTGD